MRAAYSPRLVVPALVLLCAVIAGCGKAGPLERSGAGPAAALAPALASGAPSVSTKNTTRLGGADPASDAAAVAEAVYPGLTPTGRPRAVVVVNQRDWPAALAASELASAPLGAPLLYADGDVLPQATVDALRALHPGGVPALGGAQVIRIGTAAPMPEGLRVRDVITAGGAATAAASVERLLGASAGSPPRQVIVLGADAAPALQMPAAGLAAESGAPILFVTGAGVPPATAAALQGLARPAIYLLAPQAVASAASAALARLGRVIPIASTSAAGEGEGPVQNAIAVSRFTDGTFGWGVKEPGHGLVFARASRPLDAPAGALLSASGQYGPLLLLEGPSGLPSALARYLANIQPAYGVAPQFRPVHGSYNHGWLIGDDSAISAVTQAEIDSALEIAPRKQPAEETSNPPVE